MSQKDKAMEEVRKVIFAGTIRAGQVLSERELTEKYLGGKVSGRTPVREALTILTEQGVIEQYPQVGFTVRAIGADEADKCLRLQEITEGYVVEEAAGSDLDARPLVRMAEDMSEAAEHRNSQLLLDLARRYHAGLTFAADFASAVDAIEGFCDCFALYLANQEPLTTDELLRSATAHHELATSIRDHRDPERSRRQLHQIIEVERGFISARSGMAVGARELATAT